MKKLILILILLSFSKVYSGCSSCSANFSRPARPTSTPSSSPIINSIQRSVSKNEAHAFRQKLTVLRDKISQFSSERLQRREQRAFKNLQTLANELNINVLTRLIEQSHLK